MDIFTILFYQPIFNLIVVFYRLFSENFALAIIAIALISRLAMFPVAIRQSKMIGKNNEMRVKMNEVKKKYKDNKEKQQEEMMKLNSEFMPGFLAGCLPMIIQLILFINIDRILRELFTTEGVKAFSNVAYPFVPTFAEGYNLNSTLFGAIDLGRSASSIGTDNALIIIYVAIVILAGVIQFISMKLAFAQQTKVKEVTQKDTKAEKKKKNDDKNPAVEDMSEALAKSTQQTMYLFPFLLIVGAYSFPLGLSVYWIAQGLFAIIQQLIINRRILETLKSEQNNANK